MNKKSQYSRDVSIDFIRGASILYIVGFWHLMNYTSAFQGYHNGYTQRITVMVLGIFVMVSGYLIGGKDLSCKEDIWKFYKSRFVRIYPPYLIAIILFLICNIGNKVSLIKGIFAISIFLEPSPPTLWFVTMLFPFYAIYPLLQYNSKIFKRYLLTILTVVLLLLIYGLISNSLDFRIVIYFFSFSVGIAVARYKSKFFKFENIQYFILSLFGVFASIIVSRLGLFLKIEDVESSLCSIPLAVFPALTILVICIKHERPMRDSRLIFYISTASYFMYLFHRPFYLVMTHLFLPDNEIFQLIYLYFVCLPVIVFFSWFWQKCYDKFVLVMNV